MLSSRKVAVEPSQIETFRNRLRLFAPHLLFDTSFNHHQLLGKVEQKLNAFAHGFGACDVISEVVTIDEQHICVVMAVQFTKDTGFVLFNIRASNTGVIDV